MKRIALLAGLVSLLMGLAYYFEEWRPEALREKQRAELLGGSFELSDIESVTFPNGVTLHNSGEEKGYLAPYLEYLASFQVRRHISGEERRHLVRKDFFAADNDLSFKVHFRQKGKIIDVQFTLGKNLGYDDLFYINVLGQKDDWFIVRCMKAAEGLFANENELSSAKYETMVQYFKNPPRLTQKQQEKNK